MQYQLVATHLQITRKFCRNISIPTLIRGCLGRLIMSIAMHPRNYDDYLCMKIFSNVILYINEYLIIY